MSTLPSASRAVTGPPGASPDVRSPETWAGTRIELRSATGLPPQLYTDEAVHRAEIERVFHRAWVGVGLTDELRRPGTVLVRPVGDRSVLLTVDADGVRHGFLNSCRHRGTELVAGDCAVRATIRCPYHRWGYALDGRLVSTPLADGRDGVGDGVAAERDRLGLVPVRVETWGCLAFVCLDAETPPLADWLGDLPRRLAGYELGSWSVGDTLEVDVAANWKLITENFQEHYHLPWVHPALASVSRIDDHHRSQGPGMYCGQSTTPVSDDERGSWLALPPKPGLDADDSISGRHIAVFPNVVLSVLPTHAFVMRLVPDGPGRTRESCAWLLPDPDVDDEAFRTTRRFWLDVNGEDIDVVERSHRGLARGAVPPGPLVPRFEEPLHRFHNMLADLCTADSPADVTIPAGPDAGRDRLPDRVGGRPCRNVAVMDWEERDGALHRSFEFADFSEAFAFMARVALIAEKQGHHPDWSNTWNRVSISLSTHDAGGVVTDKDREMAAAIDGLLA